MLLEDCPKSATPVRDTSPHFPVFPDFRDASYAQRYNVLCRKLMQEQLYTVACILTSPRTAATTGDYAELSEMTGLRTFVTEFAGHVAGVVGQRLGGLEAAHAEHGAGVQVEHPDQGDAGAGTPAAEDLGQDGNAVVAFGQGG